MFRIRNNGFIVALAAVLLVLGMFSATKIEKAGVTGAVAGITGMQSADECIEVSLERMGEIRSNVFSRASALRFQGGVWLSPGRGVVIDLPSSGTVSDVRHVTDLRKFIMQGEGDYKGGLIHYYWNLERVDPTPNLIYGVDVPLGFYAESDAPASYDAITEELFEQALGQGHTGWTNPNPTCITETDLGELIKVTDKLRWLYIPMPDMTPSNSYLWTRLFPDFINVEWYEVKRGNGADSTLDSSWGKTLADFKYIGRGSNPGYCPVYDEGIGRWDDERCWQGGRGYECEAVDNWYSTNREYAYCKLKLDLSGMLNSNIVIEEAKAIFFMSYGVSNAQVTTHLVGKINLGDIARGYNLIDIDIPENGIWESLVKPELADVKPSRVDKDGRSYGEGFEGGFMGIFISPYESVKGGILSCGNNLVEQGEECDGANFGGKDCNGLGFLGGGILKCNNCKFDTSGCTGYDPSKGCNYNGVKEDSEQCDGFDLNSYVCDDLGSWSGGILKCVNCKFDTSGCTGCNNNGLKEDLEECDGADLGWKDCASLGFPGGATLKCVNCKFDTTGCTGDGDGNGDGIICNNDGIKDPQEECDGADFGYLGWGADYCVALGFLGGGDLGCYNCQIDISGCKHCIFLENPLDTHLPSYLKAASDWIDKKSTFAGDFWSKIAGETGDPRAYALATASYGGRGFAAVAAEPLDWVDSILIFANPDNSGWEKGGAFLGMIGGPFMSAGIGKRILGGVGRHVDNMWGATKKLINKGSVRELVEISGTYTRRNGQQLAVHFNHPAVEKVVDEVYTSAKLRTFLAGGSFEENVAKTIASKVPYNELLNDALYEGQSIINFAQVVKEGKMVCREKSILAHGVLVKGGKPSKVVTGSVFGEGVSRGHAWVELANGDILDPTNGFITKKNLYPIDYSTPIKKQEFVVGK